MSEMTDQEKLGAASPKSVVAKKRMDLFAKADSARDAVDVNGLYDAFTEVVKERTEMELLLMRTVGAGFGDDKLESLRKLNNDPVIAIRDVALAVISLARDLSLNGKQMPARDAKGHFLKPEKTE